MLRIQFKKSFLKPAPSNRVKYQPETLTKAYQAIIEDGMAIKAAARVYGVPESTLRDRVKGRVDVDTTASGPPPLLSQEEEARLVDHLKLLASVGYGYSRAEVINIATNYAVSLGKRDAEHPLSLQWFYNFMGRWPELEVKKPRGLSVQKVRATSEECVSQYFGELRNIQEKYNLANKPERIYNVDEKGLCMDHKPPYIVAAADSVPNAVTSGNRTTVTVLGCGNAVGQSIPPYFIFPGKRMRDELMEGKAPGAAGTVSDSGWSNSEIFQKYLDEHFLKFIQSRSSEEPVLLLYDGHKSHISLSLIDWAKQHHVILFVLPAHTSHVLQPLDVGCFRPFEKIYQNECHKFMRSHFTSSISRYNICELACGAYTHALSPENLQSSFRKAGIFPFNSDAVDKHQFLPSTVFCREAANEKENNPAEKTGEITEMQKTANNTFFDEKEGVILKKSKSTVKRAYLSTIVAGKAITETDITKKIEEHQKNVKKSKKAQTPSQVKSTKNVKKGQKKKTIAKNLPAVRPVISDEMYMQDSELPGPSRAPASTPEVLNENDFDLDSDSLDETDTEKCCVCKLCQPKELTKCVSLVFTKWAQCEYLNCGHWVHLKYCCNVSVLRRYDKFYCPCHGIPCKQ